MPQNYTGGAPVAHPHALVQFWIPGGHVSTADHHGGSAMTMSHSASGDDDHAHESRSSHPGTSLKTSADSPVEAQSSRPNIPTISQLTPSADRGDRFGGILEPWFLLMLALLAGFFATQPARTELSPASDLPPPRSLIATT